MSREDVPVDIVGCEVRGDILTPAWENLSSCDGEIVAPLPNRGTLRLRKDIDVRLTLESFDVGKFRLWCVFSAFGASSAFCLGPKAFVKSDNTRTAVNAPPRNLTASISSPCHSSIALS